MWEARTPIFFSLRPWLIPGLPFSTTKPAIAAGPRERSVVAKTTCRSAMPPLVQNCLVPLRTQPPSTLLAVVSRARASDPELGSVRPIAPSLRVSGSASMPMYLFFWASVPMATMAAPHSPVPWMETAIPASPQDSSSVRISSVMKSTPPPPYSFGNAAEASRPSSWALCMTSQGVSSCSS